MPLIEPQRFPDANLMPPSEMMVAIERITEERRAHASRVLIDVFGTDEPAKDLISFRGIQSVQPEWNREGILIVWPLSSLTKTLTCVRCGREFASKPFYTYAEYDKISCKAHPARYDECPP